MDYDYTQKWSDLQESLKRPTRTEEEEKKHKERKAHELQVMLKRAEIALEGNKQLFGQKGWAKPKNSNRFFARERSEK